MRVYRQFAFILFILCLLTACSNAEEPTHKVLQATFVDGQGNTLKYYTVITTYGSGIPKPATGLNTDAFRAVFDLDSTTLIKSFHVSGHAAAIYQSKTRNYICCTTSPTASVVLSYDPNAVNVEDMIRSVQSIFQ